RRAGAVPAREVRRTGRALRGVLARARRSHRRARADVSRAGKGVPRVIDHRNDPGAWARSLGVSREAIDLYLASDVIDLHVDSYIWARLGYRLDRRPGRGRPVG